jgi:hypothetical protein
MDDKIGHIMNTREMVSAFPWTAILRVPTMPTTWNMRCRSSIFAIHDAVAWSSRDSGRHFRIPRDA